MSVPPVLVPGGVLLVALLPDVQAGDAGCMMYGTAIADWLA